MSGGIYLIQSTGELVEMMERSYESEDLLQGYLATYPNLLAGDQIDSFTPRKWLLISREAGIPSEDGGSARWSVDHLFLDQDAIPTLVEVKRSTDTRIRREVVGQMLDYAANAVVYWPIAKIQAQFETNCQLRGDDPDQVLTEFLGPEAEREIFWERANTNLQAGRVRMLFVADIIPPELRRIVEFLNVQMNPAEVLAVEIRQYAGQGLKTLVPRVIGQTSEAQQKKSVSPSKGKQWDEQSFFQELQARCGKEDVHTAREILRWANEKGLRTWWGKGAKDGSFFPMLDHSGRKYWLISLWTYGRVEIQFQMMKSPSPFIEESKRIEFLRRLNELPGITLPPDVITRRPSIPLSKLGGEEALTAFLRTMDWAISEIKLA